MAGVLVIENEEPLLRLLTWALMDAGFSVSMSRTVPDAANRAGELDPTAIILNMSMPAENKQSEIKSLRTAYPLACVIDMLTSNVEDVTTGGADGYAAPPYRVSDIVDQINQWQPPS